MIGVLVFPGFQILDAAGVISVFEIAGRFRPAPVALRVVAVNAGPVSSSSGVEILAHGLESERSLSTLIVAGGQGVDLALKCAATLSFIKRVAAQGTRVASVCNGAYLLAETGLLDDRQATTHWSCTKDFIARYPKVQFQYEKIFVRDGGIWTSAGITAGIDLALAMVAEDHSDHIAHETARQLVLYHRRGGGQSQLSTLLELKSLNGRFDMLLSWIREHLDQPLTVDELAEHAGMSSRNFARAFASETGLTPSKAVERLRVEAAQERIACSREPIERVAGWAGFRDPERMRRAFIRTYGQPPQSLRREARGA